MTNSSNMNNRDISGVAVSTIRFLFILLDFELVLVGDSSLRPYSTSSDDSRLRPSISKDPLAVSPLLFLGASTGGMSTPSLLDDKLSEATRNSSSTSIIPITSAAPTDRSPRDVAEDDRRRGRYRIYSVVIEASYD